MTAMTALQVEPKMHSIILEKSSLRWLAILTFSDITFKKKRESKMISVFWWIPKLLGPHLILQLGNMLTMEFGMSKLISIIGSIKHPTCFTCLWCQRSLTNINLHLVCITKKLLPDIYFWRWIPETWHINDMSLNFFICIGMCSFKNTFQGYIQTYRKYSKRLFAFSLLFNSQTLKYFIIHFITYIFKTVYCIQLN